MAGESIYFESSYTIPPGGQITLALGIAEFLHVVASSQSTFGIAFDSSSGGKGRPGANFRAAPGRPYKEARLENLSGTDALTVTIGWGKGEFQLQQFKFLAANTVISKAHVTVPAGTTELVLPANANRREARIINLFSNVREFMVADSNAAADRGEELPPGKRMYLQTTAAIYAHNPDSADMKIAVVEVAE